MNPTLIALICLAGAGLIGFWCSYRRLWWPVLCLALLMAVIALQLYFAFKGGPSGYHDLAALTAMNATVLPGLAGTVIGLIAGDRLGTGLNWRSWQGAVTGLALLVACGAVAGAMMV